MVTLKEQLLSSSRSQAYFNFKPQQLEELWNVSNQFIDTQRLQCLEIEWYPLLEQHFFLSLLTCRDAIAKLMLKRIMEKFGIDSRRMYKLRTAFVRATQDPADLETHLKNLGEVEYDAHKIGMVSLKSTGDYKGYIQALSKYVDQNPLDTEAWAELAESYAHVGDFDNAVNCYEQCLLLEPLAYNIFARVGELKRLQAATSISSGITVAKQLISSSLDYLCRSVELNPVYLRGWCGVYLVSNVSIECDDALNAKAREMIETLAKGKVGNRDDIEAAQKILSF